MQSLTSEEKGYLEACGVKVFCFGPEEPDIVFTPDQVSGVKTLVVSWTDTQRYTSFSFRDCFRPVTIRYEAWNGKKETFVTRVLTKLIVGDVRLFAEYRRRRALKRAMRALGVA